MPSELFSNPIFPSMGFFIVWPWNMIAYTFASVPQNLQILILMWSILVFAFRPK